MSVHDLTIRITLDDAALAEYNEGLPLFPVPEDPSEWDERDLAVALENELAEVVIRDYDAVPA